MDPNPALMHNFYSYLYNKAVFELLEDFHGKGNAMVFARSAATGCQKFPVHWGGDCDATWESMAEDLRGGLSFCASGAAFWSHDIGGFSGTANASLYKRWVAFGLLSTHSRLHGSSSYRVPWLFDEESVVVMRHFRELKNRLFPYSFRRRMMRATTAGPSCGRWCWNSPMIRPARISIGNTCWAHRCWSPRYSGRTTSPNITCLPDAGPTFFRRGYRRGQMAASEAVDFMQMPLLVRENTILPMGGDEEKPNWKLSDELTLQLFQIADGADVSISVPASDSPHPVVFRCQRSGGKLLLSTRRASPKM